MPGMTTEPNEFLFNNAYCERVKAAREAKGWSAATMASALGIPAERYRKYENRSPLPPYLIERFCLIAGIEPHFLITGKRQVPILPSIEAQAKRRA